MISPTTYTSWLSCSKLSIVAHFFTDARTGSFDCVKQNNIYSSQETKQIVFFNASYSLFISVDDHYHKNQFKAF